MEITTHPSAGHVELRVTGRLDAMWAEHLNTAIENTIRAGSHNLVLNFAGVDYISSMGLRVLLVQYKLLKSIQGSLAITHPNEFCRNIFSTVGLTEMLAEDDGNIETAEPIAEPKQRRGAVDFEIYPQNVTQALSCQLIGDPDRLSTTGFSEKDCRALRFSAGTFGVGIGGFGQGYADCASLFGEFLAAGGCAITQPTNESQALPDYVVEEGKLSPEVETLYAIAGEGEFSTMTRFDAAPDCPGKVSLSEFAESMLDISQADTIAMVVLAEAAGIVGATLRKSPAVKPLVAKLPEMRDWLSFTTERTSEKNLCLIVGVVSRSVEGRAKLFLRPFSTGSTLFAHLHGAVFPYRPIQRGELPLAKTISNLLASSSPSTLLHLMTDTRPFEGVGETDLVRGACWFGALPNFAAKEQA